MYMFVICYSESTGNTVNDVQFEYLVTRKSSMLKKELTKILNLLL